MDAFDDYISAADSIEGNLSKDNTTKIRSITWAMVAVGGCFVALRMFAKVWFKGWRALWWDDWFMFASWLMIFCLGLDINAAVKSGFGNRLNSFDHETQSDITFLAFLASTLGFLAAAWSKTGFILQVLRCCGKMRSLRAILWLFFGTINVIMTCMATVPWVMCTPKHKAWMPWIEGSCDGANKYWQVVVVAILVSAIMDLLLTLIPFWFLHLEVMNIREKIGLWIAMGFGFFSAGSGFLHACYSPSSDFFVTSQAARYIMWAAVEVVATMIAGSIPMFRLFLTKRTTDILYKEGALARHQTTLNWSELQRRGTQMFGLNRQNTGGSVSLKPTFSRRARTVAAFNGGSGGSGRRGSGIFKPGLRLETDFDKMRGKEAIVSVKSLHSASGETPESDPWGADQDPYDVGTRDLAATPTTPTTPRDMV